MHPLRAVSILVLATFATSVLAQTAPSSPPQSPPPYQAEIDTLAGLLVQAHNVERLSRPTDKFALRRKILVADFLDQGGQPNVLGQQLADALFDALQTRLDPSELLSRKQFQARMQSEGISPADLQNAEVLQWQATQAGATQVITGRLSSPGKTTSLDLALVTLHEPTQPTTSSTEPTTELILPPDLAKLVFDPLTWPPDPHAPIDCPANSAGITTPKCILCASPDFTAGAGSTKWQGKLLLKIAVDEQGQVTSAIVLAGGAYGTGEQSVATVRKWKFQPATKDGQPIRVCIPAEIVVRRLY